MEKGGDARRRTACELPKGIGGSSVSNDLIDIKDFFQLVVVPELQKSNIVHSYAARCIENLLIIKDDDTRAIIRRSCEEEPNSISVFESSVFPSLQKITDDNLSELFPYVFKLFSQLVDLNGPQQLVDLMDATHEGLFQKAMEAF
ncbi:hypothetical protein HAX54_017465 [Datura stramonium]|uniref:Exportin-2 C-terminal domain-containing protein n=1 Tax=Datura stramonium TaxID=4076 RepID=A0ABS8UMY5_DATST|nr:hypothetical protein [Datura stramonium]